MDIENYLTLKQQCDNAINSCKNFMRFDASKSVTCDEINWFLSESPVNYSFNDAVKKIASFSSYSQYLEFVCP